MKYPERIRSAGCSGTSGLFFEKSDEITRDWQEMVY
jgi:hypothetical protein